MFKIGILCLIILLISGCLEQKQKVHYEYTVWVGSQAIAIGYCTNNYVTEGNMVRFKIWNGKTKIVPHESLLSIDTGCYIYE